jgi:Uncharacterized membrane protein
LKKGVVIIQNEIFSKESEFEADSMSADSAGTADTTCTADIANASDIADTVGKSKYSFRRHLSSMMPDIRKYTMWLAVLFFFSLICGYIYGYYYPSFFDTLSRFFQIPERSAVDLVLFIFVNNARIAGMLVFLGFIFAVLPVFIVFANGFMVGIVSESIIRTDGLLFLLVGLLPHGIIEIPLILFSAGIGFKMGVGTLQVIFGKKNLKVYLFDFFTAAVIYAVCIVPLLFAAAMIEVYVTGFLLEYLFS